MVQGILQLTKQSLRIESRRTATHAIRFGLAIVLYLALVSASLSSWRTAQGLSLLQNQLLITAFFLSATAIFGFSQTITEEKEDETLGLLRLTDLSPLSIMLGKSVGILLEALLLIAIQIPFAMVAITLGGITPDQVFAGYVALVAYLWLLAMVGVTTSVLLPNGAKAACWTAVVVALYALPPFLGPIYSHPAWKVLCQSWEGLSLPARLAEVTESGFQQSPWSFSVWMGLGIGLACLVVSSIRFDLLAQSNANSVSSERSRRKMRSPRRVWTNAIAWREYLFLTGGRPWMFGRIAIQILIFVIVRSSFQEHLGFTCAWSAIASAAFGILDGTWFASRLFADEIKQKTWSALVQTPRSLSQIAFEKTWGWGLGLAPTIIAPFLFIAAMMIFHENAPHGLMQDSEVILGTLAVGFSVFSYLHLLVLLSLYLGWKGTPMTLTICFASGWMYVTTVFASRIGVNGRCALFGVTCLILIGVMLMLQRLILRRLTFLAEIA